MRKQYPQKKQKPYIQPAQVPAAKPSVHQWAVFFRRCRKRKH